MAALIKPAEEDAAEEDADHESPRAPWYARLAYVLHFPALGGSLIIFVLYWMLVVPSFPPSYKIGVLSYFHHGANFALALADVVLTNQPLPLAWGLHLFLYGVAYILWSVVHFAAKMYREGTVCDCGGVSTPSCTDSGMGGEGDLCYYIYSAMDWHRPAPTATMLALVLFVAVPLITLAFWALVRRLRPRGTLRDELRCVNIYAQPPGSWVEHFAASTLLRSRCAYLGARVLLLACLLGICTWFSVATYPPEARAQLLIWLSNWTLYLQLAYAALAALSTLQAQRMGDSMALEAEGPGHA